MSTLCVCECVECIHVYQCGILGSSLPAHVNSILGWVDSCVKGEEGEREGLDTESTVMEERNGPGEKGPKMAAFISK